RCVLLGGVGPAHPCAWTWMGGRADGAAAVGWSACRRGAGLAAAGGAVGGGLEGGLVALLRGGGRGGGGVLRGRCGGRGGGGCRGGGLGERRLVRGHPRASAHVVGALNERQQGPRLEARAGGDLADPAQDHAAARGEAGHDALVGDVDPLAQLLLGSVQVDDVDDGLVDLLVAELVEPLGDLMDGGDEHEVAVGFGGLEEAAACGGLVEHRHVDLLCALSDSAVCRAGLCVLVRGCGQGVWWPGHPVARSVESGRRQGQKKHLASGEVGKADQAAGLASGSVRRICSRTWSRRASAASATSGRKSSTHTKGSRMWWRGRKTIATRRGSSPALRMPRP